MVNEYEATIIFDLTVLKFKSKSAPTSTLVSGYAVGQMVSP